MQMKYICKCVWYTNEVRKSDAALAEATDLSFSLAHLSLALM